MPSFRHEGKRLVYKEYGDGPHAVLLLPGLLFSKRMHEPLAAALAARGCHVIALDLLGHGGSDRPTEMWRYSMEAFGRQAIALLDHLDIEHAVIGGTSLGANATLEAVAAAPQRVRGMIVEMPVLDNALLGCAIAFTPLMIALTFGEPVMRLVAAGARRVPQGPMPQLANLLLDWIGQDPKPSAAVLQGLFFGRVAPPRSVRATLEAPALVIGHPRDPVHPFSDADMLARELPSARLIDASSILELRISPERLTGEICAFVDGCWAPRRGARARRGTGSGGRRRAAPAA